MFAVLVASRKTMTKVVSSSQVEMDIEMQVWNHRPLRGRNGRSARKKVKARKGGDAWILGTATNGRGSLPPPRQQNRSNESWSEAMEISELQLQSAGVAHWCMYETVVNQVFTAANVPHTRCLGWHDPSVKSSAHYEYQCVETTALHLYQTAILGCSSSGKWICCSGYPLVI